MKSDFIFKSNLKHQTTVRRDFLKEFKWKQFFHLLYKQQKM